MPESKRHLDFRTTLYLVLTHAFAKAASIGSDQFVYWNASDPSRCLAPDAFVRLGAPDESFASWKTWERGAPELCVEIVSESHAGPVASADKLARYHELGVRELVHFDPEAAQGSRIRVWDRLEGDLVERAIEADETPCLVLGATWMIRPTGGHEVTLRLAGQDGLLLPTPAEFERERADAEGARARSRTTHRRARSRAAAKAVKDGRGPRYRFELPALHARRPCRARGRECAQALRAAPPSLTRRVTRNYQTSDK